MKTAFLILSLLIGVACAYNSQAQKTAVHWYLPTMSLEAANSLKGYDLVIIDPEIIFNNPESLDALRADNPDIKIYCYFNAIEWFNPMFSDKPWSKNIIAFLDKHEEWFLHGKDGFRLTFWIDEKSGRKTETMNCRSDCPRLAIYEADKKISYIEFITDRFINDILKTYRFDGVLMDNLWLDIHWLGKHGINKSGMDYGALADNDSTALNDLWQKGMHYSLSEIKKFGGGDFAIIGNPGHLGYPECSGKMLEDFPEKHLNKTDTLYQGWYENFETVITFSPGLSIFNARADNYFFTLCSSMLRDNIYFSYSKNTKYENKYQLGLGKPLKPLEACADGIHFRNYENGTIFVDPLLQEAWIVYNDGRVRAE